VKNLGVLGKFRFFGRGFALGRASGSGFHRVRFFLQSGRGSVIGKLSRAGQIFAFSDAVFTLGRTSDSSLNYVRFSIKNGRRSIIEKFRRTGQIPLFRTWFPSPDARPVSGFTAFAFRAGRTSGFGLNRVRFSIKNGLGSISKKFRPTGKIHAFSDVVFALGRASGFAFYRVRFFL
jgi:hypothetical protein